MALAPPLFKPFTQLLVDLTLIPRALRPGGARARDREDILGVTAKLAADFPLGRADGLVLHPFLEVGVMAWTPEEQALQVSRGRERADPLGLVTGLDLSRLGPGDLGLQFAWVQPGFVLSPDYPNNVWSMETRYRLPIRKDVVFEIRYRHRQDIERLVGARERLTDDNILGRVTVKF